MLVRGDVLLLLFLELLLQRLLFFLRQYVLTGLSSRPLERCQGSERIHSLQVRITPRGARHSKAGGSGRGCFLGSSCYRLLGGSRHLRQQHQTGNCRQRAHSSKKSMLHSEASSDRFTCPLHNTLGLTCLACRLNVHTRTLRRTPRT